MRSAHRGDLPCFSTVGRHDVHNNNYVFVFSEEINCHYFYIFKINFNYYNLNIFDNSVKLFKNKIVSLYIMNKRKRNYIKQDINDDSDDNSTNLVHNINNHIYFYASVNQHTVLQLNGLIKTLNTSLLNTKNEYDLNNIFIYIHINSLGGEIYAALSSVDTIINSKIPIISIVEGCAASAATLISIVCNERHMTKYSSILIHQLSSGFWGNFTEIKDDVKNLKYLENLTKKIYIKYSNKKMSNKYLNKILKHDILWGAKKCKKLNIIDKII